MEASETRANSTIGIDGGMIGPITAVAAVSAAAKLGAYLPSFVIMFCIILPVPAASAMAEPDMRSEEHTSELQSLMRISYAVFCLKKKNKKKNKNNKVREQKTTVICKLHNQIHH